jgi:acetone carboxylase gamma subunit
LSFVSPSGSYPVAMKTENRKRIRRGRDRVDPKIELKHHYTCPHCGQSVDRRAPLEVIYHETQPGHEPLRRRSLT